MWREGRRKRWRKERRVGRREERRGDAERSIGVSGVVN